MHYGHLYSSRTTCLNLKIEINQGSSSSENFNILQNGCKEIAQLGPALVRWVHEFKEARMEVEKKPR